MFNQKEIGMLVLSNAQTKPKLHVDVVSNVISRFQAPTSSYVLITRHLCFTDRKRAAVHLHGPKSRSYSRDGSMTWTWNIRARQHVRINGQERLFTRPVPHSPSAHGNQLGERSCEYVAWRGIGQILSSLYRIES